MPSFSQNFDTTIRSLEQKLSAFIDAGYEFDFTRSGDVLTIEFDSKEKIVITPQAPMEQLWISANYAGHRFNWKGAEWQNEKTGEPLDRFVGMILSEKFGTSIDI